MLKKLSEKCNDVDTYLDFIIETENTFGLEHKDLITSTEEELDRYIDYLEELCKEELR